MQNIGKASNFYPGRVQSDAIARLVLVADTEQHFTIPDLATVAVFASTGNFYVLANGETAAAPSAYATSVAFPDPNTIAELNPTVLNVIAGVDMSVIAPANCNVVISFYRDSDLS